MKWLITDFDGTLRNSKIDLKSITKQDLNFVIDWQKQGNKLVIATGRSYYEMKKIIKNFDKLSPDFLITNTGSAIYDKENKQLNKIFLSQKTKDFVLDYVSNNEEKFTSLTYSLENEENFFFNKEKKDSLFTKNKPLSFVDYKHLHCLKLKTDDETWFNLIKHLKTNNCEFSSVINTINNFVSCEIHSKKTSKGNAINFLQDKFNIKKEDILVAGDDFNDHSMFEMYFDNSYIVRQPHNKDFLHKAKTIVNQLCEIKTQ